MKKHGHRTFIRKSCFTLFELLISVGLLVVLSVVLLRTLVLTSDYWHKTDEQSQLQADAKTFFSLLTDDLGNLVYSAKNGGFYAPLHIESNRLCMVTHSRLQSMVEENSKEISAYSDVGKVIYRFVAPGSSTSGRIERMCSSDAVVNGNTLGSFDMSSTNSNTFYPSTLVNRSVIIDTVADLRMTAYKVEDDELKPISHGDVFNSPAVRMIHVKLVLLPVKHFREYDSLSGNNAKNAFITKHGRVFYKTFWVKPTNQ